MSKHIIREALPSDLDSLADLKCRFVQNMYRGFLPTDMLKQFTPAYYRQEFEQLFSEGHYTVSVLEQGNTLQAAIIYGEALRLPGCGLILEAMSAPQSNWDFKHAVLEYAVNKLHERGFSMSYVWILRNNFRIRYICEQFGFRKDGALETIEISGVPMEIIRYQYHR